MIIIPAIDLIGGACVRLTRGKFSTMKKYFDNPVKVAEMWKKQGADWLHVIDLDGARTGRLKNLEIVSAIKERMDIKIQYGGGIRNNNAVRAALGEGADRVILGTGAINDEDFLKNSIINFKDKIILSLDYGKGGNIFKNGWQSETSLNIFSTIKNLEELGVKQIIITDISKDGTLEGINLDFLIKILDSSKLEFIIAGGVAGIEDIVRLKKLESRGIIGVIIGKALYESKSKINLGEAIRTGRGE